MVAWIFVPTEVLHVRCMGRVLKIDFVPVFNTTSRARICMNFQTVFADIQVVLSSTKCMRSWVRCTILQKKNLIYRNSQLKISPVLKNSNEGCLRNSFLNFSCAHAWDQEIWTKICDLRRVYAIRIAQNRWQPLDRCGRVGKSWITVIQL